MNRYTYALLIALMAGGCGQDDSSGSSDSDAETELYRQALVGADDIALEFESDDARHQALAGETSELAAVTADTVISTNALLGANLGLLQAITAYPPSSVEPNARVWEGENGGKYLQIRVEKSAAPRGSHFEYALSGRDAADPEAPLLPLIDGDVVRIETRPAVLGRQGYGVLRFHFDNINLLEPENNIDGTARITFRRVGGVRQVRVRLIDVATPEDPNFPAAAAYEYVQLSQGSGAMKWFSHGDVQRDGEPYENVAMHSAWRPDLSGVAAATAFGGSLEVDYWHMLQCWDSSFQVAYEVLEIPGGSSQEGDITGCFEAPTDLDVPDFEESLPNEDPEIPTEHPDEVESAE